MTAFDRLKLLCEKQGISVNDLEEKLGIGRNSLYSWKKNIPKGTNLIKVADYFEVSTDYLLGRTDNPNSTSVQERIPDDLDKMLDNAMTFGGKPLTDKDREAIRAYVEGRKSLN
ncbi:helix-turn-helix domain-containing protein [Enterococcus sp. AZ136]|uniref:helix-turn-helix domain-containing protein n=1 Tax=Enterococcus sp. AZ136 TaxID=2774788 RepID=UPI003D2AF984